MQSSSPVTFSRSNLLQKISKTIQSILCGQSLKQNQYKLISYRKEQDYIIILCTILTQLKNCQIKNIKNSNNMKIFILLEIKKNLQKLNESQQCWWLLKDKISNMVKDIYLRYCFMVNNIKQQEDNHIQYINNFHQFFNLPFNSLTLINIIRYLTLTYQIYQYQIKNLQNRFINLYSQQIIEGHFKLLKQHKNIQFTLVKEYILTNLILLKGLANKCQIWGKYKQQWYAVLDQIIKNQKGNTNNNYSLVKLLAYLLRQYIEYHNNNGNQHNILKLSNTQKNQQLYNNNNQNYQYKNLIINSIKKCLTQLYPKCGQISSQKRFYLQIIKYINFYFFQSSYLLFTQNNIQQGQYNKNIIAQIIYQHYKVIKEEIQKQQLEQLLNNQQKINQCQSSYDQRLIILKSILIKYNNCNNNINNNNIININNVYFNFNFKQLFNSQQILLNLSYQIAMLQFSLYFPFIIQQYSLNSSQFIPIITQLRNVLQNQNQDFYGFIQNKKQFIWTILKYIYSYQQTFQTQSLLFISQTIDLLAYKCQSLSYVSYQLLDQISNNSTLSLIEVQKLVNFVERSMKRINNNQFLISHYCYFHIVNIILCIQPIYIFNNNNNNTYIHTYYNIINSQYHNNTQNPTIQTSIIFMLKNILSIQKQQFNYQLSHKLNNILHYFIKNKIIQIIRTIRYDEYLQIVHYNYNYQIFTQQAGEIYFYLLQFNQNTKDNFCNSLNLYDFWERCQSQKLDYYINIYFKFIDSKYKYFTSSQQQKKLIMLKKNLWHRYVAQNDQQQRNNIFKVFQKFKKYLYDLIQQCQRIQTLKDSKFINYNQRQDIVEDKFKTKRKIQKQRQKQNTITHHYTNQLQYKIKQNNNLYGFVIPKMELQ